MTGDGFQSDLAAQFAGKKALVAFLPGHLPDASGAEKHLEKATDRLFPAS